MTAPSILLETSNPVAYNYCYIPSFNRYYWITEWTSDHGFWRADCSVDVLTTYRTEILESYQYVTRNQSKYNLEVPDNMYPMIDGVDYSVTEFGADSPFAGDPWKAILGIAGRSNNPFNGLSYFQITRNDLEVFMDMLFDPDLGIFRSSGGYFDVSSDTMKALIQPLQYIPLCYGLPYDLTAQGAPFQSVSGLFVGFWPCVFPGATIKMATAAMGATFYEIWSKTFNLPTRSIETQPLGTWASKLPYTEYKLFAGPFGQISIDASKMNIAIGNSVTARIKADLYGNAILTLEDGSGNIIYRDQVNVAVDFKLTSLAINKMERAFNAAGTMMNVAGSAAGGVASGIMGNPMGIAGSISGGVGSVMNGIKNHLESKFPQPLMTGSTSGNLAQVMEPWKLQTSFYHIASEDREHFGRPLCERVQLSDSELSGYTECANATIAISGTSAEHDMIINFLNTGFYKEN